MRWKTCNCRTISIKPCQNIPWITLTLTLNPWLMKIGQNSTHQYWWSEPCSSTDRRSKPIKTCHQWISFFNNGWAHDHYVTGSQLCWIIWAQQFFLIMNSSLTALSLFLIVRSMTLWFAGNSLFNVWIVLNKSSRFAASVKSVIKECILLTCGCKANTLNWIIFWYRERNLVAKVACFIRILPALLIPLEEQKFKVGFASGNSEIICWLLPYW